MSATMDTSQGRQLMDPYKSKNLEDPPLPQKVEDLVAFINEIKYGMLTTKLSTDKDLLQSRCMALAGEETGGIDLLFHTNLFSHKTQDLTTHPTETNMSFLDPVSGGWASISGTASMISHDPDFVKKYYSPSLKTWLGDLGDGVHDGGPADPRIGIIRLQSKLVTHVLPKRGMVGRAMQEVKGAVKGDVPEINSIREIGQAELEEWRRTHQGQ